jgi:hypothetical protein
MPSCIGSIPFGDHPEALTAWQIGSGLRSGEEPAREQRSFGPFVKTRAKSLECVLDGWIFGEVSLLTAVLGEMVQLFAAVNFAAQVGPL